MRSLNYGREFAVLPIGFQNLITGQNKDFNIFEDWGIDKIEQVSLINFTTYLGNKQSIRLLMGSAPEHGELAHDQTLARIWTFKLIKIYEGTYKQIFQDIMRDTGKKSIAAYVYK